MGLFKHRVEEFREMKRNVDKDLNIQTLLHTIQIELPNIFWQKIRFLLYESDVNQLPPVIMKYIADESDSKTSCSTDDICKIPISEFMNQNKENEIVNFKFHMTAVVR